LESPRLDPVVEPPLERGALVRGTAVPTTVLPPPEEPPELLEPPPPPELADPPLEPPELVAVPDDEPPPCPSRVWAAAVEIVHDHPAMTTTATTLNHAD
jgi:hypothetical protein